MSAPARTSASSRRRKPAARRSRPPAPPKERVAPPPAPAAPSGPQGTSGKILRSLPVRVARWASAAVGFVATVLGIVFVLFPAVKPDEPPREKGALLTNPTVEWVSFGQYLAREDTPTAGLDATALARPGVLVEFDFAIDGYKNEPLRVRYGLVDAGSGEQLARSRDTELTPMVPRDRGVFLQWIERPRAAERVYVQVALYAEDSDTAIGRVRTPIFEVPALGPR